MIIYKPGFKFFFLWLAICAAVFFFLNVSAGVWGVFIYGFMWSHDGYAEENYSSKPFNDSSYQSLQFDEERYENGSYKIKNLSNTGYNYSDGKESWVGMCGEEHLSNGEVIYENAYIPGRRDIYNASGEYIGYEYKDSFGTIHRVDK